MSAPFTIQSTGNRSLSITPGQLTATGRVSPVLNLALTIKMEGASELRLDHLLARIYSGQELAGTGQIVGAMVYRSGGFVQVQVPVIHRMLDSITDQLGAGTDVSLSLRLQGIFRWRESHGDAWQEDDLPDNNMQFNFTVPRSKWYEQVLTPVRNSDFVYLEVAIPRGIAGTEWRSAVDHLRSAEAAYATGDDDAVFNRLRAALDAMPGAKQHVFDALPNDVKRKAIDELAKKYGGYLHLGRHVGAPGSDSAGKFPVNHLDAGFAVAAMKVLLSYATAILDQANTP